ncbi:MAG: UDP-2,3-diacylglucosamine diphosphatase [Proteobacteria bacterium]|nr:UDP-2,3-diacylglucosamine diphosphatase [Pseudomonadota bacterium]
MTQNYRSLWLSDVHLGTRASRAAELLNFLAEVKADRIYLVGDIVDLARMKSKPRFCDLHMRVVSELVRLAGSGTEILYIPGNHDCEFRSLVGNDILGVPILMEAVHETASGERLLVTHGDLLDGRIRQGTNLERFGAAAYFLLSETEVLVNKWRKSFGQDYVSISMSIIHRLKGAREYIRRFERFAAELARERGLDGIVCGHIHRPNLRRLDGILYANDGDWVDHQTALGETRDGELQLLTWQNDEVSVGTRYELEPLAA